jgi:hypothetical protein
VGEPFLIDNTPPRIEELTAGRSGSSITLRWNAVDDHAVIQRADYSLNGGDWTRVEPVTRLSDSRSLDYTLVLDDVPPGENTIALRVTDLYENQGVAKAVVP